MVCNISHGAGVLAGVECPRLLGKHMQIRLYCCISCPPKFGKYHDLADQLRQTVRRTPMLTTLDDDSGIYGRRLPSKSRQGKRHDVRLRLLYRRHFIFMFCSMIDASSFPSSPIIKSCPDDRCSYRC